MDRSGPVAAANTAWVPHSTSARPSPADSAPLLTPARTRPAEESTLASRVGQIEGGAVHRDQPPAAIERTAVSPVATGRHTRSNSSFNGSGPSRERARPIAAVDGTRQPCPTAAPAPAPASAAGRPPHSPARRTGTSPARSRPPPEPASKPRPLLDPPAPRPPHPPTPAGTPASTPRRDPIRQPLTRRLHLTGLGTPRPTTETPQSHRYWT